MQASPPSIKQSQFRPTHEDIDWNSLQGMSSLAPVNQQSGSSPSYGITNLNYHQYYITVLILCCTIAIISSKKLINLFNVCFCPIHG